MRQQLYPRPFWLLFVVFAFLAAPALFAQNAELSGSITDPDGRALAGARVVVQSVETGVMRATLSNQQGEYRLPALPPGSYDLTVEAERFKIAHQNGLVLEVDQRARVDFSLTLGRNTESITVQGSAPLCTLR